MCGHRVDIHITAIDHNLVEGFLRLVEDFLFDGIGDHIDKIGFLPHQEIDRSVFLVTDVGKNLFKSHQSNLKCFTVMPLLMS